MGRARAGMPRFPLEKARGRKMKGEKKAHEREVSPMAAQGVLSTNIRHRCIPKNAHIGNPVATGKGR